MRFLGSSTTQVQASYRLPVHYPSIGILPSVARDYAQLRADERMVRAVVIAFLVGFLCGFLVP